MKRRSFVVDGRRGGAASFRPSETGQRAKRVVGAFALIAALLGLVSISGSSTGTAQVGLTGVVQSFTSALSGEGDANSLAEFVQSWETSLEGSVSPEFEAEVLTSEDRTFWVANDGSTVGFSFEGSAEQACAYVRERLEEKGWTAVESGSSAVMTFGKTSGTYRWIGMSTTEVSQGTSVVLSVRKAQ